MHLYQRKSPWRFLLSNFINSPNSASSLTCTLQSRPPDLLSFLPLSPRQPTRLFPCEGDDHNSFGTHGYQRSDGTVVLE